VPKITNNYLLKLFKLSKITQRTFFETAQHTETSTQVCTKKTEKQYDIAESADNFYVVFYVSINEQRTERYNS